MMTGTEDPSELRNFGVTLAAPVATKPPPTRPTRPVATPVRAPERAASTDAQPRSQQLWEAAFPEAEGDVSTRSCAATEADLAGGPGPGQDVRAPEDPVGDTAEQEDDSDDELIMDVDCVASQQL